MDRVVWTFRRGESARHDITVLGTSSARGFFSLIPEAQRSQWRLRRQSWKDFLSLAEYDVSWDWSPRSKETFSRRFDDVDAELPKPQEPRERRKHERFSGKVPVEMAGDGFHAHVTTQDISMGGLRIEIPEENLVELGAVYSLTLKLPWLHRELSVNARVVGKDGSSMRLAFLAKAGSTDQVHLGLFLTQLFEHGQIKPWVRSREFNKLRAA